MDIKRQSASWVDFSNFFGLERVSDSDAVSQFIGLSFVPLALP